MSEAISRTVRIVNKQGLHARPCMQMVKAANRFQSEVTVTVNGESANGKSIMELMTLASPVGTELRIEARGSDAGACADALAALVDSGFGEEI